MTFESSLPAAAGREARPSCSQWNNLDEPPCSTRAVVATVVTLLALGIVTLYSASAIIATDRYGDEFHFLRRQVVWAAIGIAVLLGVSRIDYHRLLQASPMLLAAALVLLILVLVPGIGWEVNGARRWLRLGDVNLQVSEFARIAVLLWVVRCVARSGGAFLRAFLPSSGAAAACMALIAVEPDVGGALFLGALVAAVWIAGGLPLLPLAAAGATAAAVISAFALERLGYIMRRLESFVGQGDPLGASYQLRQSLIALGAGGVFGQGLGRGIQKLRFLPEPHSDFILAILGEEMGFIGTLSVVVLFVALLIAGRRIAARAPDPEGSLLAFGATLLVVLQAAINVAVISGCLPTKGMPLPFVSYGGSSLIACSIAIGLVLSVARSSRRAGMQ